MVRPPCSLRRARRATSMRPFRRPRSTANWSATERATPQSCAEFRNDLEGYVSFEVVQACVGSYFEMAPAGSVSYYAFTDPSGGSDDSFTLAISHRDGDRVVIDCIREVRPP